MGILLGPDAFTVGSDTNIDSYAGSPLTFAYNTGSGADIYVNAANDRLQGGGSPSPTVFATARITNGTVPTADQAILGNYNASSTTAYPILTLRTASGSGDFYAVYQYGTSFAIDRVTSYSFTNVFFSSASYTTGTDYYVRFRAIGAGSQVDLYLWIDDVLIGHYADTHADRKTSGVPGVTFFYDTANAGYVDNLLIGDGAGIARINGGAASLGNGGSPSVSMSGWLLEENDLVLAALAIGDNDNVDFTMAMTTSGYTLATGTDLFANDTQDTHLALFYKFMGATPDTTVQMTGQGGTDAACALVVQVFRGVDTTTPFDVAVATATGVNTYTPNPPSCNHNAPAEAVSVLAASSGHTLGGASTYTFPTGYTTAPVQTAENDTSDITVGMSYRYDPADPEDPGTLTHSGSDSTNFSWCALTAVLRPVVTTITLESSVSGSCSIAAALTTDIRLASVCAGSGSIVSALTTDIPLASQLSGTATTLSNLSTAIELAAALSGAGMTASALETDLRLLSALQGAASMVADIQTDILLETQVAGSAAVAADLETGVSPDIAVVLTGTGACSGDLSTDIQLASALTASVALAAALETQIDCVAALVASGSMVSDLQTDVTLASQLTGTGTVDAGMVTDVQLAAALSSAGTMAGQLATEIEMAIQLSGTGQVDAALDAESTLASILNASAQVAADLTTDIQMLAALQADGTLAAALETDLRLQSQLLGSGVLSAELETEIECAAILTGSASVTGSLVTDLRLLASLQADGVLVGALNTDLLLASQLSASATVLAQLELSVIRLLQLVHVSGNAPGAVGISGDAPTAQHVAGQQSTVQSLVGVGE